MSVNEKLIHFFKGIDLIIGKKEKDTLRARNFSAHGSFGGDNVNFEGFLQAKFMNVYLLG